ncbi:MAG TPA: delta(1)-pyrroline-2-carboxylate reductase family protein, partial [Steroidobacter sp.]
RRHLDARQTAQALPYARLVPEIARASSQCIDGSIVAPERLVLPLGMDGSLLCMPATSSDIAVSKILTVRTDGGARDQPAIQGELIVFDVATGRRLASLDGPTVTARRTAAVTLLAIERLAPQSPQSALLIGTGTQAHEHARALNEYFGVNRLWIAGTTLNRAQSFSQRLRKEHPTMDVTAVTASELHDTEVDTDLVIALTTAKTPVIPANLPARVLAIGVGAFRPDMAEIPESLLQRRSIIVDHLKGARTEAGDLLQAVIDWDDVRELGEISANHRQVVRGSGYVFKSVGHAAWDLAAARLAVAELELKASRPAALDDCH